MTFVVAIGRPTDPAHLDLVRAFERLGAQVDRVDAAASRRGDLVQGPPSASLVLVDATWALGDGNPFLEGISPQWRKVPWVAWCSSMTDELARRAGRHALTSLVGLQRPDGSSVVEQVARYWLTANSLPVPLA
jgi:hypothetical protein